MSNVNLEAKIREAIVDELKRQAEVGGGLKVEQQGERVRLEGPVDLDSLVIVVLGQVAGGP